MGVTYLQLLIDRVSKHRPPSLPLLSLHFINRAASLSPVIAAIRTSRIMTVAVVSPTFAACPPILRRAAVYRCPGEARTDADVAMARAMATIVQRSVMLYAGRR
jgi:hypothetical protein